MTFTESSNRPQYERERPHCACLLCASDNIQYQNGFNATTETFIYVRQAEDEEEASEANRHTESNSENQFSLLPIA